MIPPSLPAPAHGVRIDGGGAKQDEHKKDDDKGMYLVPWRPYTLLIGSPSSVSINGGGTLMMMMTFDISQRRHVSMLQFYSTLSSPSTYIVVFVIFMITEIRVVMPSRK